MRFLEALEVGAVEILVVISLTKNRSASALGAFDDSAMTRPPPS